MLVLDQKKKKKKKREDSSLWWTGKNVSCSDIAAGKRNRSQRRKSCQTLLDMLDTEDYSAAGVLGESKVRTSYLQGSQ